MRWVGLDHGLPHAVEPDSECARQVEVFRGERRRGPNASTLATYPHLLARATLLAFPAPTPLDELPPLGLEAHLRRASASFLDTRRASALISTLVVPATFLVAVRFVGPGGALFAAALAGLSLLGVSFGQQARPHAPAAALAVLAVAAAMRLARRGDLAGWALVSAAAALAVATLQSGVAVLGAVAGAHLRGRRDRLGHPDRLGTPARWLEPRALCLPAALTAALVLAYPFVLEEVLEGGASEEPSDAAERGEDGIDVRREGQTLWIAEHNLELDRFDGGGFARVGRTLVRYEPALLVLLVPALAALALGRSVSRGRVRGPARSGGELAAVLGYAVPYALALGLYGETFERFVLPLVPFLAVLAAAGLERLPRRGAVALGALALAFTVATSARLAWLRSQPDTFERAAGWVARELGPDAAVYLSPLPNPVHGDSSLELPLPRTGAALDGPGGAHPGRYGIWTRYQDRLPETAWAAGASRFDLRWLVWSRGRAGVPAGVEALAFLREHPASFFEQLELPAGADALWFAVEDHRGRPENATELLLQDALARFGERVARSTPERPDPADEGAGASDEPTLPFGYQDRDEEGGRWPNVALRALTARATGPAIDIWRVDAERLPRGGSDG